MTILEIKAEIEKGANYNGVVYGKDNGKNWTTLFIYLNGQFTKIAEVYKTDAKAKKAEIENELKPTTKTQVVEFGENYIKNGLDVAVGEAE